MTRAIGVLLIGFFVFMACLIFALAVSGSFGGTASGVEDDDISAARELVDAVGGGEDGIGRDFAVWLLDSLRYFPWVLAFIVGGGTLLFFFYWMLRSVS